MYLNNSDAYKGADLKTLTPVWKFLSHTHEPSINILNYKKAENGGKEDGCSPE